MYVDMDQFSLDTFRKPPEEFALVGECAGAPSESGGQSRVQVCLGFGALPAHDTVDQWKIVSSQAHLRGERAVRHGISIASPRTWSLAQAKCFVDRLHCNGVTPVFAPDFAQTHAHTNLLATYAARLNYAMSQGRHRAQIALLSTDSQADYEALSKTSAQYFSRLGGGLASEHLDYDVVDEAAVAGATSVDQRLLIAKEEFELLILPPLTSIGVEAGRKIAEFVEDGGKVIATALMPVRDSSGDAHDEVRDIFHKLFDRNPVMVLDDFARGMGARLFSVHPGVEGAFFAEARDPEQLLPAIRACVSKTIRPVVSARWHGRECGDLQCVRRILEDGELFFFANTSPEAKETQLMLRCAEAPYMLDLETGSAVSLPNCAQRGSRTVLLHRFEPYASLLVHFAGEPALTVTRPAAEGLETAIVGDWDFELGDGGHAIYRKSVHIPSLVTGQTVLLRVVEPADAVEFVVNNGKAGVRGWAPFEVDVTQFVRAGANQVELRVCHPNAEGLDPSELIDGVRVLIY